MPATTGAPARRSQPSPSGLRPAVVAAAAAMALTLAPQPGSAQPSAQGGIRASGDIQTEGQLVSTAASGAPLAVASSEVVSNLNADLLDGMQASAFAPAATVADLEALVAQLEALIVRLHPRLDLENSRFRATVTFDEGGELQPADAVPLTGVPAGGFFTFTRDFYADAVVMMVDGRGVNAHWWVFTAPLTDLAYTLRIEDVETGVVKSYVKAVNSRPTFTDTAAFPDSGGFALLPAAAAAPGPRAAEGRTRTVTGAALASCVADADTVCLVGDRFAVEVAPGAGGSAVRSTALATSHTGAHGLFSPSAVDVVTKVVETPASFVVNIGTLANQAFTVEVTDTCTGTSQTYVNPAAATTNFVDDTTFGNVPCSP